MTLAELISTILPEAAPVVTDERMDADDAYTPLVDELTPGTVFIAVDESLYASAEEWFMVVEPLDDDGYLVVEAGYPDGTTSETNVYAGHLHIVEVW